MKKTTSDGRKTTGGKKNSAWKMFREDLGNDLATLKRLSAKDRLVFLYDYYRWYILATVFILITIGTIASMLIQAQRPCRLRICAVIDYENNCREWFDDFADELKKDGRPGRVDVNMDQPFDYDNAYYYVFEAEVMTTVSSGRMDVAICNEDLYSYLLALNACAELSDVLPEDLYRELESRDMLRLDTANLTIQSDGTVNEADGIDGHFGILLNDTEFCRNYRIEESGLLAQAADSAEERENLYLVLIRNTEHMDDCLALVGAIVQ